jgi:hypothetical protein
MLSAERGEVEGLYTANIHAKQLLLATCALGVTEARRSIPPGAAHAPCVVCYGTCPPHCAPAPAPYWA